nr:unnamed protein product [Callosobruchus chinensis]
MDKDSNKLVDGGAEAQATQALKNIGHILEASGSSYSNVIKSTIMLRDINDFGTVNEVYRKCKLLNFIGVLSGLLVD